MSKIILTDCDGVLVNWAKSFDAWMTLNGYEKANSSYHINKRFGISKVKSKSLVKDYNNSSMISNLEALRDSVKYVRLLNEQHGYKFIVVSSLSKKYEAWANRTRNLAQVFDIDAFKDIICLDCGEDKDQALHDLASEYEGSYWIEDKAINADLGAGMGYKSLLVSHEYNEGYEGPATRIDTWEEIYNIITA